MDNPTVGSRDDLAASAALQRPNSDVIAPLLSEYEAFIAALQQQIEFYKVQHESLRNDLTELITENKRLSEKLKNVLGNKLSEEAVLSPRHRKESDMVTNLQQQLSLTIQEKESAVELWHMAQREVDNLEEEIKTYLDNRHVDNSQRKMEDIKKDFSEAIIMLESKLNTTRSSLISEKSAREDLQKKHEKIIEENLILTESLNNRKQELEAALTGQCKVAGKLQEVEKKAADLEKQVDVLKTAEMELQSALSQCHDRIDAQAKKIWEAQDKVRDSIQLIEHAVAERDAAINAELRIREENSHLQQLMTKIVDEAGETVKEEVQIIKDQYNGKLKMLLYDMKKLETECSEKEKKLNKEIQEKNILEGQLEQIQKEGSNTTNMLERRMNMVHEELTDVRHTNLQLVTEKENLRSEMERMLDSHATEIQRLNRENQGLEQRILVLQGHLEAELQLKTERNIHIEKLSQHIKLLEEEKEKMNLMSRKEQDWQHYQQEHQELLTQLQKIQKQSDTTASELEHHLEKQHSMKTKYQKAMKTLTEKFEKRIRELRCESNTLKRENKSLETKLYDLQVKLAEHISKDDLVNGK
ncbi:hypothetical protein C0J52_19753 [Blattella germanica]|nr:hypothetical protein C0J52_19753 [Blattella germanica]